MSLRIHTSPITTANQIILNITINCNYYNYPSNQESSKPCKRCLQIAKSMLRFNKPTSSKVKISCYKQSIRTLITSLLNKLRHLFKLCPVYKRGRIEWIKKLRFKERHIPRHCTGIFKKDKSTNYTSNQTLKDHRCRQGWMDTYDILWAGSVTP